ncbi:hypothetical protein HBB16_20435 [Pseudonocardia sp. MCCB 268]|nr:hypothetical protein [Pseudonocardia cytotoxica]
MLESDADVVCACWTRPVSPPCTVRRTDSPRTSASRSPPRTSCSTGLRRIAGRCRPDPDLPGKNDQC